MLFLTKELNIVKRKISITTLLWFVLAVVAAIIQIKKGIGGINNYLIFKGVFWHTLSQTNLYLYYPAEYFDVNHYGPVFGILIAPFAALPNIIGCFFWCMANAIFLFYAVKKLPVSFNNQNIILLIAALEMMTSIHNVQFNPMLTSWIIFSFILVHAKKDFWATLFIAAGFFIKLYGIVGLAFLMFSDNKIKFLLSFAFWCAVMFFLPMLISSPSFIIQSYKDWYFSLAEKNNSNQESAMQGMSAMRVLRKVFLLKNLKDIYVLIVAGTCCLLPLARFNQFKFKNFQLSYLAFILIAVVIFSSSAESATYVIAMVGAAIWYVTQPQKKPWVKALIIFAFLLTSLSTTDFFPNIVKVNYIRPYALKALPCFIIWIVLFFQLVTKNYSPSKLTDE
jgi:hypothetical protein